MTLKNIVKSSLLVSTLSNNSEVHEVKSENMSLSPHLEMTTMNDLEICFLHIFVKCRSVPLIFLLQTRQWLLFSFGKKPKLFNVPMRPFKVWLWLWLSSPVLTSLGLHDNFHEPWHICRSGPLPPSKSTKNYTL